MNAFFTRSLCLAALLSSAAALAQPIQMPFKPVDIRYSASLDRLIMISANPHRLSIVHPLTGATTDVNLNLAPLSLSVSPDGTHAAVGHDAWISYVNLTSAYLEKNLSVSTSVKSLLLSGQGAIWVPPSTTINIATGSATTSSSAVSYGPSRPTLHPNGNWIYYTDGYSSSTLYKGDVSTGVFRYLHNSGYMSSGGICGNVFPTADGNRLLTSCGGLFRTSADRPDDLSYNGSLSAASYITSAADSAVARRAAVIPGLAYSSTTTLDTEIQFYDNQFFALVGRLPLPKHGATQSSPSWHGRHVFYSPDSTKLYVVLQADPTASLTNDFAIYPISLASGAACAPSISTPTPTIAAAGGSVEISLTATQGCLWQATSAASSWLSVISGGISTGSGTVTVHAQPNPQTTARSATVTIAGIAYTVNQDAASAATLSPISAFPARPVAAEYSTTLDRLVLVSSSPDQLIIHDPVAGTSRTVPLALPPTALSVSPDGLRAAVGHDGRISYVDLVDAYVAKSLPVSTKVYALALSPTTVFAFPQSDQWASIRVLNIETAAETLWNNIYAGMTAGRISPNGKYLYINSLVRVDLSQPLQATSSSYGGSPLQWFSQDGARLFNGNGTVYRLSDIAAQDLMYNGTVETGGVISLAHSSARQAVAYIATGASKDTSIKFLNHEFLANVGSIPIPKLPVNEASFDSHGRHLFWNSAGNRLFALIQADPSSRLLNDYALYTVSFNRGCNTTLGSAAATVSAAGGSFTATVNADGGCGWSAQSNASWVTVSANAVSAGPASISYIVDPNPTTSARSATITVDGKTLTITQSAGTHVQLSVVTTLPFRVADAEFSHALDRIVAISSGPNRLNIYDPATGVNTPVALPLPANAVAVQHSGRRAAACHDGLVSIVDLETAALVKTLPASVKCIDIVYADNGYVYLSQGGGWGSSSSIDTASGLETRLDLYYAGTNFRLNSAGNAIYTSNTATSAASVSRYSIATGPMTPEYESDWYPDHSLGYKIWFTRDGRMVADSGNVFRTGSTRATDFVYTGSLSGLNSSVGAIVGAAHSTARRLFASIGPASPSSGDKDTTLYLHGDKYLSVAAKAALPLITVATTSAISHGKFIFWDSTGAKAYAIVQADPSAGFFNDYALFTLSPALTAGCSVSLGAASGAVTAFAGAGNVAVNAASDCYWEVKTTAPWIQIDSGSLGAGIGNVSFSVLANRSLAARTATIAIGAQTYTLTQAGAAPRAQSTGTYSSGLWRLDSNNNGSFDPASDRLLSLGWAGAKLVTGDWNGDGKTDAGVYSAGYWFLDYNGDGAWDGGVEDKIIAWGWSGATPIVGDWNGDGRAKIGVYSNGFWFLDYNGDLLWDAGVVDKQVGWGWSGVTTVTGDWNGDGRTKIGVYVNGFWFLDYNGDYLWDGGVADKQIGWGWAGATTVTGDWNGDGRTKIGVYSGGVWYLDYDGDYLWHYPATDKVWTMGWSGTTPLMGDWNGDGKTDIGAFIDGYWYLDSNGSGAYEHGTDRVFKFGQSGDLPLVGWW